MNETYEILEGEILARALRQMIDTKAKQMFERPEVMTVGDARAFEAVNEWLEEIQCGQQQTQG